MGQNWVWLISPANGLPHRVPEGVVEFYAARGYEVTDIDGELDSDSEEFANALAERQSARDAEELKGKSLDEALDGAGLSKSGSADEKRQRLAEHQAAVSNPPSGDQPEGNEE